MVGPTQLQQPQWLEEASSSPVASRRHPLLTCPPNTGRHIFLCPRYTPPVRETALCCPYLLQGSWCQTPCFYHLPPLVQALTVLNQFTKQSPTVPLVHLQIQHLSIYLVLQYAAAGGLNSVHAEMGKSRVWPPAFWEWPGHCAGENSCDDLQILRAELLPPSFPSCRAWNSPKYSVILTWRSPERGNLCQLLYLGFSLFCSA